MGMSCNLKLPIVYPTTLFTQRTLLQQLLKNIQSQWKRAESKILFSEVLCHLVVTIHVNTTLLQKLPSALQVLLSLFFLQCFCLNFNRYYRFWEYIYVGYQHLALCPTSLLRRKLKRPLCKKCTSLLKPVLSHTWDIACRLLFTAINSLGK